MQALELGYVGRVSYKCSSHGNSRAGVISSNVDVKEVHVQDLGFPKRAAATHESESHARGHDFQPNDGQLSKKFAEENKKIVATKVVFSFKEISDANIMELFQRLFSLKKDFSNPAELSAHPTLKSLTDLAKHLVRIDFCSFAPFSNNCSLQPLTENQLADFISHLNSKSPFVAISVFAPPSILDEYVVYG